MRIAFPLVALLLGIWLNGCGAPSTKAPEATLTAHASTLGVPFFDSEALLVHFNITAPRMPRIRELRVMLYSIRQGRMQVVHTEAIDMRGLRGEFHSDLYLLEVRSDLRTRDSDLWYSVRSIIRGELDLSWDSYEPDLTVPGEYSAVKSLKAGGPLPLGTVSFLYQVHFIARPGGDDRPLWVEEKGTWEPAELKRLSKDKGRWIVLLGVHPVAGDESEPERKRGRESFPLP